MKYIALVFVLCATLQAENLSPVREALPDAPSQRPFWTVENKIGCAALAGLITADAITTQRGLNQGLREANPLMRPFVTRGSAGQAVGSAIGFGAGLGTVYLLHHTHHYKAERVAMRLILGVESAVVVNNILAIKR